MKRALPLVLFQCVFLLLAACGGGSGDPAYDGGVMPAGTKPPPGTRADRVLVKPTSPTVLAQLLLEVGVPSATQVPGTTWYLLAVPAGTKAAKFVSQLESSVYVAAASLDLGLRSPEGDGSTIPAGGFLLSAQLPDQSELQRIGAPVARTRSTGAGVRVGVLDTGVLPAHESVAGHVDADGYDYIGGDPDPTEQTDGIDQDEDGLVDEDHGHGTFVASLIVAVAPQARIVPFRVLDADGIGTSSGVASAITEAAARGVHAINLSVSVGPEVQVVQEAIQNARLLGVQVIASAGNTADPSVPPSPSTFVVTAVDASDVRADFASFGVGVDLSAPGVDIHGGYPAPPGTAIWSGTSFSTAIVSGGFALVRSLNPLWTSDQCLERLRTTSAPVAPGLGAGRLDLDHATQP